MDNFIKAMIVYVGALILCLISCKANAFQDYDVEWPISDGKKQTSTVVITIDGCKTKITMKNSDIESFSQPDNIKKAVQTAIQNTNSGCKN